jgi:hypothetical protein
MDPHEAFLKHVADMRAALHTNNDSIVETIRHSSEMESIKTHIHKAIAELTSLIDRISADGP